jgi:hypothetical protein
MWSPPGQEAAQPIARHGHDAEYTPCSWLREAVAADLDRVDAPVVCR